jgi:Family of unknown function (DUF5946)
MTVDHAHAVVLAPCPGCGAELVGDPAPFDARSAASGACRAVYGEVAGYELEHVAELGRWHQLLVDAYAAQHATARTPVIGTAFALIGLHLALDLGWDGLAVRDAHQWLANAYADWPRFEAPEPPRGALTIVDVALASTPEDYVAVLQRWAATVWQAWREAEPAVAALVHERLRPERFSR